MDFWLRNGIFAIILSVIAYFLLANQELLIAIGDSVIGSSQTESQQPIGTAEKGQTTTVDKGKKVSEPKESTNKAADGLSRFYANLHGSDDNEDGPQIRNGVVYLPEPKGNLELLLEAKAMVTRPLKENWRSDKKSLPFRTGQTLLQKMTEYAENEGLEVIWRLNRDLLIKDPFRINKDILQTAYQLGMALHGYFPEGVDVYFCYKQRSIVFQTGPHEYMADNCKLLQSRSSLVNSREGRRY